MNFFLLASGLSTDAISQAYSLIFPVIMYVASLWAISTHERTGQVPALVPAHCDWPIAIVRFLLSMPAIVTMFILSVCLFISMIYGWLFVRFGLAAIIVVAGRTRPPHALQYARTLPPIRFWRIFAQISVLVLFVATTALPIAVVTDVLSALHIAPLATLFLSPLLLLPRYLS